VHTCNAKWIINDYKCEEKQLDEYLYKYHVQIFNRW
jgi:hypothetical protein